MIVNCGLLVCVSLVPRSLPRFRHFLGGEPGNEASCVLGQV